MKLKIHYQMMSLRENLNKLIEETLTMEKVTEPRLQSQPMYDSDKAVDYTEEVQEMSQQVPQKSQDIFPENKIVNRHKIRYTATRIKYSPTRIKSINLLSNISYTVISKNDFYNESFTWMSMYYLLKI